MMSTKIGMTGVRKLTLTCAALATAAAAHGQLVLYVDDDAPANGYGRSWETALDDLQSALLLARVTARDIEIRIGDGLYLPSQSGERAVSFDLDVTSPQSGFTLTIKGGFRGLGGGGDPGERDLSQFRTVLSGDLAGNDQPGFVGHGENSWNVLRMSNNNGRAETWLDGLVIRGGFTNGAEFIVPYDSMLRLTNCVFTENGFTSGWGGGAVVWGPAQFGNVLFLGNRAAMGGGVSSRMGGKQSFINCSFVNNEAQWGTAIQSIANADLPLVVNSILFDQSGNDMIHGTVDLRHSCLTEFYPGQGNIVADPIFVDPKNGDYRLDASSPCIDSGTTVLVPRRLYTDLASVQRFFDAPLTGRGLGVVDMGAFEYQGCDIDFNGDGQANTVDLLAMLNFLNNGCP